MAAGLGRARGAGDLALSAGRSPGLDEPGLSRHRARRPLAGGGGGRPARLGCGRGRRRRYARRRPQVGYHALSVAVLGSYLRSFAGGRIEAVKEFDLDAVTGDDPKAAKLARVLAYYAERLPDEERELLARLSVFPRGVTLDLLGVAGRCRRRGGGTASEGKAASRRVAGSLRSARAGLRSTRATRPSPGPRTRSCASASASCSAARPSGSSTSWPRPSAPDWRSVPTPSRVNRHVLDRYERLIEATRLAGREQEAFDLFWYGLGWLPTPRVECSASTNGATASSAAFSPTGRPEDLGATMALRTRSLLANDLALFARRLGRLAEARAIRRLDDGLDEVACRARARHRSGFRTPARWRSPGPLWPKPGGSRPRP